jgi:hypothetical protein
MTTDPYASASRVFWIVDNGSSHNGARTIQPMRVALPTACLVHPPVHASWLNQVEIYFSILQRKAIRPADFTDLGDLAERLLTFQNRCNSTAEPFDWTPPAHPSIECLNGSPSTNLGPQNHVLGQRRTQPVSQDVGLGRPLAAAVEPPSATVAPAHRQASALLPRGCHRESRRARRRPVPSRASTGGSRSPARDPDGPPEPPGRFQPARPSNRPYVPRLPRVSRGRARWRSCCRCGTFRTAGRPSARASSGRGSRPTLRAVAFPRPS